MSLLNMKYLLLVYNPGHLSALKTTDHTIKLANVNMVMAKLSLS